MTITVRRNEQEHRYEALLDSEVAATVTYRQEPGRVVLLHTETRPEFSGRGVASALVRGALDGIRARGERAVVVCPFVTDYIRRHPEYQSVVAT